MVKQTGVLNAQMLHKMAKISYENAYDKGNSMKPIPELKVGDENISQNPWIKNNGQTNAAFNDDEDI